MVGNRYNLLYFKIIIRIFKIVWDVREPPKSIRNHNVTLILDNLSVLLYGFIISYISFVALWIVQIKSKDAGWVDIGWTLGLGSLVIFLGIAAEGLLTRRIIALHC